jgi:excisionase family DNA binding protein
VPTDLNLDSGPHTLGPADVARVLGVGVRQARDWINEGGVYSFRIGRRILVPKAALKRLLEQEPRADLPQ